jgi:hypothetical protein
LAPTRPWLSRRCSTPTTLQLLLPPSQSRLLGNGSHSQGKGHGRGGGSSAPDQGNKDQGSQTCPAPTSWPPSTTLRLGPSTCTPIQLWGAATTPPSEVAGSHRCALLNHGRPSLHATLGSDPHSATDVCCPAVANNISILDTLARLVRPRVIGQLLQYDDGPDAALTYRVGCRQQCIEPHHT